MRVRLHRASASLLVVWACSIDSKTASQPAASAGDSVALVRVARDRDGQRVETLAPGALRVRLTEPPPGVIVRLTEVPVLVARADLARAGAPAAQIEAAARSQRSKTDQQHGRVRAILDGALGGRLVGHSPRRVVGAVDLEELHDVLNALVLRGIGVEAVRKALAGNADVASIEAVVPVHASLRDSVPLIHADAAWGNVDANGIPDDGAGIRIGIVDTGVDYTSADLGGCLGPGCKVAGGYDFVNGDPDPMDDEGHGTHVASIAAGNGTYDPSGAPIPGIAPGARIYAYKVLDASGSGDSATVISGIQRCADPNGDGDPSDHLDVCNLSLGGSGNPDDAMSLAIDNATAAGVLFAVAAGNGGPAPQTIESPGTARTAVTVAAACKPADIGVDPSCSSAIAPFSSRGPVVWMVRGVTQTLDKPDVSAPGVNICATEWSSWHSESRCLDSRHVALSGTSMSTAEVAGVAALLRQEHPEMTPAQVKALLASGATNLNLDPTIQGAGRVDALASVSLAGVPGSVGRLDGVPTLDEDTPAARVATFSSAVTVTNTTAQTLTYQAGVTRADAGLSISFSPAAITLDPGQSGTFTVTRQVDHAVVPSGVEITGTIAFSTTAGSAVATVSVGVRDRLLVAPAAAELGVDLASQPSWTTTVPIQLTNRLADTVATYSASVTCCTDASQRGPPYVSATLDRSSISIAPGATATVNLTVTADNSQLFNGTFSGAFQITSPLQSASIPIRFFKGYGLQIQTGATVPLAVAVSSATAPSTTFTPVQTSSLLYLLDPGPYSVEAVWAAAPAVTTHVVQPGVATDQPVKTVTLDPSQATATITLRPITHTGVPAGSGTMIYRLTKRASAGGAVLEIFQDLSAGLQFRVSPVSSSYSFTAAAVSKAAGEIDTWLYELPDGIPADVTLTNTAADFVTREALSFRPASARNTPWLLPYGCLIAPYYQQIGVAGGGSVCFAGFDFAVPLPVGVSAPIHFFNSASRDLRTAQSADAPSISPWINDGSASGQPLLMGAHYYATRDHIFSWPTFIPWGDFGYPLTPADWFRSVQCAEPPTGRYLSFASSPVHDALRWENHRAEFAEVQGERGETGSFLWGCSEDWSATTVDARYELFVNGTSIASGVIDSTAISVPLVEGQQRWVLTAHPVIGGVRTQVQTVSTFSLTSASLVDENPPAIRELHLVSRGQWQEVFDASAVNRLQFEVDPVPGLADQDANFQHPLMPDAVASVAAWASTDGSAWAPVSVSTMADGSFLSDALPVVTGASLYWFRVYAADLAGNTLTYTFQVPAGAGYFADTTAPTVSLTAPSAGSLQRGSIALAASASDDVAVSRVDFRVDGASIATSTAPPYTATWDSTALPDGAHVLSAAAYDAAGNSAVSPGVAITTDNTSPTVAITSPANGATPLAGTTFTISASASDASGVASVQFFVNGTLTCTDSVAPYTCGWAIPKTKRLTYTLTAKATDAANNSATSAAVTVTSR